MAASDPVEALHECGCPFELVEDGAVQRKRWFHEPQCMTPWERLDRVVAGQALLTNPEATLIRDAIIDLQHKVDRLRATSDFFIPPEPPSG